MSLSVNYLVFCVPTLHINNYRNRDIVLNTLITEFITLGVKHHMAGKVPKSKCRCPVPPIRFCTRSSTHILSHREASASAQKAWSSAGRRGPRFGVGAGVCLGWSAARDVACVWAPWGVLGEGKARGWAAAGGFGAIGLYIYI